MDYAFAQRVREMRSSAIREILKVTERPEVISFAGGLPAPELFPLEDVRRAVNEVLGNGDPSALQYSSTEGYPPLREYIAETMRLKEIGVGPNEVLLTNGSQQALDLLAKLFLDPGDTVILQRPSYLGAIQVFSSYEARFVTVRADAEGVIPESLEQAIREAHPKLIYLTPTFANPTGETMSLKRRQAVAGLAAEYGVPVIEDDPYSELRFSGEVLPPLASFDQNGWVIYLSTFSKTVAPGMRLGWIIAQPDLMSKLVLAKQGTDLHTSSFVQRTVHQYLVTSDVTGHLGRIRVEYGRRRDTMADAIRRTFPAGVHWTEPEGGMFLWVTLPMGLDAVDMLHEAVEEKVAYVPGASFFPNGGGENCLRLNFSNSTPALIEDGVKRLAGLLARRMG
jgi:2-aminoadipate transaminase